MLTLIWVLLSTQAVSAGEAHERNVAIDQSDLAAAVVATIPSDEPFRQDEEKKQKLPPRPKGKYRVFHDASIEILHPADFKRSPTFSGFMQESTGTSILISLIPAPYGPVRKGFTAENLKKKGMVLKSIKDVELGAKFSGCLMSLTQRQQNVEFRKWIFILGDAHRTRMVTATFATQFAEKLSPLMKSAVLSARIKTSASDQKEKSSLPFTTKVPAGMKLASGLNGMRTYFPEPGSEPAKQKKKILFMLAPSIGKVDVRHPKAYAQRRLMQTATFKEITIGETIKLSLDGLEAYESVAAAKDEKSGEDFVLFQTMVFETDRYFLIGAVCPKADEATWLPRFKSAARTFKRIKKTKPETQGT